MSTGLLFPVETPPQRSDPKAVLAQLSQSQQHAALCCDAPALVIAGPGSGKTRTLIARLEYLLASGAASPAQICAITFTRKAAAELRERLHSRLGATAAQVTVGTFHQLSLRLRPLPAGVRLIDEGERQALLSHIVRRQCLTARGQPLHATTLARRVRRLSAALSWAGGAGHEALQALCTATTTTTIAIARGDADQADQDEQDEAPPAWLAPAAAAYRDWLVALRLEDLDDLLLAATAAVKGQDEGRTAISPFRYVHVDEYQDVSGVQRELLRGLAARGAQIFAIGDPDQSIYAFRGANLDHFYGFPGDFPGTQVFYLRENYRATNSLVRAGVALIAHAPAPSNGSLPPGPAAQAVRKGGEAIEVLAGNSPLAEAIAVARRIEWLVGGTSLTSHDQGRAAGGAAGQYGFSDIAVLTRTVARADEIAAALSREGIPILRPRRARPTDASGANPAEHPLSQALHHCPARPDQLDGEQAAALARARDESGQERADEIGVAHESDEWDARLQRVAVLTLHGSKGLEFPVVFLCGCEADLLPGRAGSESEIAEERRLFYVGLTRAKDLLWLSHAGTRPRSPFFDELPADLLHVRAPIGPRRPKPPQLKLF
jgi:DNA helicase-2/ATP-dependent DNA helicase PcrA